MSSVGCGVNTAFYVDLRCGYVFTSSKYDAGTHVPYFAITTDDNKLNYLTANVAKDLIRILRHITR